MKWQKTTIKEIFDSGFITNFFSEGLRSIEIELDDYYDIVFDKNYKIIGAFNNVTEWLDNYIWGGPYYNLKKDMEELREFYKFFFFDGKEIGKNYKWEDVTNERVEKKYQSLYGKEVIVARNYDDNIYYAILYNGKIIKANPLYDKDII